MRWIKHLTDAHADEKLAILRAESGFEGYGFFWFVLEIIAKHVDGSASKTSVTYPLKFWCQLAGTLPSRFQRLANSCATLGLLIVMVDGNMVTIGCPNILKYRDEWSRKRSKNSGGNPEPLRTKDSDTDTEAETEKDKGTPHTPPNLATPETEPHPSPVGSGECVDPEPATGHAPEKPKRTKKAAKAPAEYSASFLAFWEAYPRKVGKAAAFEAWQAVGARMKAEGNDARGILAAIKAQVAAGHLGVDIQHIPHPTTWLNQARWEDEIAPPGALPAPRGHPPQPRTFHQKKQAENEQKAQLVLKILEAENGQTATPASPAYPGGHALPIGQIGT